MGATVFASLARPLIVAHSLGAMLLVGASVRHATVAIDYGRARYRVHIGRTYAALVAAAYVFTMTLGALVYPTYRYYVRGLFLDRHLPWASNLFSIKENLATIGLPLALGAFFLSRVLDPERDRVMLPGYIGLVLVQTAIVAFNLVVGLYVTLLRGV
ncbi:MAG TPA: hypothetical protein VIA18_14520 [Polyangia bacterium]|jgi:hypothetical protein|nr:hypothetical protein [Polyangia bacterium]